MLVAEATLLATLAGRARVRAPRSCLSRLRARGVGRLGTRSSGRCRGSSSPIRSGRRVILSCSSGMALGVVPSLGAARRGVAQTAARSVFSGLRRHSARHSGYARARASGSARLIQLEDVLPGLPPRCRRGAGARPRSRSRSKRGKFVALMGPSGRQVDAADLLAGLDRPE